MSKFILISHPASFLFSHVTPTSSPGYLLWSIHRLNGSSFPDVKTGLMIVSICSVLFSPPLFQTCVRDMTFATYGVSGSQGAEQDRALIDNALILWRRSQTNPSPTCLIRPYYSFLSLCSPLPLSTCRLRRSSLSLARASLRAPKKPW